MRYNKASQKNANRTEINYRQWHTHTMQCEPMQSSEDYGVPTLVLQCMAVPWKQDASAMQREALRATVSGASGSVLGGLVGRLRAPFGANGPFWRHPGLFWTLLNSKIECNKNIRVPIGICKFLPPGAFGPFRHRAWVVAQRPLECSLGSRGTTPFGGFWAAVLKPLGEPFWGLFGSFGGLLGASLGPLGGLLGPSWGLLGPSRGGKLNV